MTTSFLFTEEKKMIWRQVGILTHSWAFSTFTSSQSTSCSDVVIYIGDFFLSKTI